MLNKKQILEANDIEIKVVNIPEWGGKVNVKALTGTERDKFEASIVSVRGKSQHVNMQNIRAKLCSLCIVDENGERLFSDAEIGQLGKKSAKPLDRIFDIASEMSGITKKDVEALKKTLEMDHSEDFASD